jgi:hypothetical protein
MNNGGMQSSLTDAEAKAKKVKVVKVAKTGKMNEALLDLMPKESAPENSASPDKNKKKAPAAS